MCHIRHFLNMHFCVKYFFTSVAQSVIWLSITSGVLNYLTGFICQIHVLLIFCYWKELWHVKILSYNLQIYTVHTYTLINRTQIYTFIYLVRRTSFLSHTMSLLLKQTFAVHVYITGSTDIDHTYYITVTLQLNT